MALKSTLVSMMSLAGITGAHAMGCHSYRPVRGHPDLGAALQTCIGQTARIPASAADAIAIGNAMEACMRAQGFRPVPANPANCEVPPN